MGWQPKSGHVTQLHADGSGWNDCWEASLVRYLREAGTMDLHQAIMDALNEVSSASRGTPDDVNNPPTDIPECERALTHYGIPVKWTTSWPEAQQSQMGIYLVNGILLSPPQYPAGWFGGENYPDHFILALPYWQGSAYWYNDPLAANKQDCQYNSTAVAQSFSGAFLLPAVPGQVFTTPRIEIVEACAINSRPSHDPKQKTVLKRVAVGATGLDWGDRTKVNGEEWGRIQVGAISGYVLTKAFKDL